MAKNKRRREFEAVAADALSAAYIRGEITLPQRRRFARAIQRPGDREQIRSAFIQDVATTSPESLTAADVAGKIDFDALLDLLSQFFPKVAKLKKFAGLLKIIMGAVG